MGASIYYFAGPTDNHALSDYAQSLGLRIYAPLIDRPEISASEDPCCGPFCFLSPVPKEELHPYGNPLGICDALDPLIEFWRASYRSPDLLVMGRLYCSDDGIHSSDEARTLYDKRKPFFAKLAKWIKSKWKKLPTRQYIGPEAERLLESGAKLAYLPPGVKIETKMIP